MDVVDIVTKVIGVEPLFRWFSDKLKRDYGVKDIEIKRTSDSVVLIIRGDELDKVESDLRSALFSLKVGEVKKIEVKVEGD